jgi:hypothetical protein
MDDNNVMNFMAHKAEAQIKKPPIVRPAGRRNWVENAIGGVSFASLSSSWHCSSEGGIDA